MVQVCHNRLHGHHHSPALDTGAPAIFHFMVQPTAKSLPMHIQSKAACILWSLQTLLLLSKGETKQQSYSDISQFFCAPTVDFSAAANQVSIGTTIGHAASFKIIHARERPCCKIAQLH